MYNTNYELNIRHLAIIIVKDCVDQRWWVHSRDNSGAYLSEEQKESFSVSLLEYVRMVHGIERSYLPLFVKQRWCRSCRSLWLEWLGSSIPRA